MSQPTIFNKFPVRFSSVTWPGNLFYKIPLGFLAMILWMLPLTAAQAAAGSIDMDLTYAAAGIGYQTGTASVTLGGRKRQL